METSRTVILPPTLSSADKQIITDPAPSLDLDPCVSMMLPPYGFCVNLPKVQSIFCPDQKTF